MISLLCEAFIPRLFLLCMDFPGRLFLNIDVTSYWSSRSRRIWDLRPRLFYSIFAPLTQFVLFKTSSLLNFVQGPQFDLAQRRIETSRQTHVPESKSAPPEDQPTKSLHFFEC